MTFVAEITQNFDNFRFINICKRCFTSFNIFLFSPQSDVIWFARSFLDWKGIYWTNAYTVAETLCDPRHKGNECKIIYHLSLYPVSLYPCPSMMWFLSYHMSLLVRTLLVVHNSYRTVSFIERRSSFCLEKCSLHGKNTLNRLPLPSEKRTSVWRKYFGFYRESNLGFLA